MLDRRAGTFSCRAHFAALVLSRARGPGDTTQKFFDALCYYSGSDRLPGLIAVGRCVGISKGHASDQGKLLESLGLIRKNFVDGSGRRVKWALAEVPDLSYDDPWDMKIAVVDDWISAHASEPSQPGEFRCIGTKSSDASEPSRGRSSDASELQEFRHVGTNSSDASEPLPIEKRSSVDCSIVRGPSTEESKFTFDPIAVRVPEDMVVEVKAPDEFDPHGAAYVIAFDDSATPVTRGARAALKAAPTWAFNPKTKRWSGLPRPENYALLRAIHPEFTKRPGSVTTWTSEPDGYVKRSAMSADIDFCEVSMGILGEMLNLGANNEWVDKAFAQGVNVLQFETVDDVVHVHVEFPEPATAIFVADNLRDVLEAACARVAGVPSALAKIDPAGPENVVSLHG